MGGTVNCIGTIIQPNNLGDIIAQPLKWIIDATAVGKNSPVIVAVL